ncbi:MAG: hypothetical protein DMG73_00955 [Acidobacteria bacterium]|nr:MAG: hypothetical protein DMG73_00955 [Acidobacteriota bacterium]
MHPALKSVAHRPWPLPESPWVMAQTWHDLLFAHWQIVHDVIRKLVPEPLALDSFHGQCWIAVTPFHMSGVRARGLPALPGLSRFAELNVRTYVTLDDKPGVFFFSLDAANLPAVFAARTLYRLPYFHADMSVDVKPNSVRYHSRRYRREAEFRGVYRPVGEVQLRRHGTPEHWLTERYCLYTVAKGRVYRGEIHHQPWPLQDADAEIKTNTMAAASGITLPDTKPLLHFSRRLDVLVWPLRRVR